MHTRNDTCTETPKDIHTQEQSHKFNCNAPTNPPPPHKHTQVTVSKDLIKTGREVVSGLMGNVMVRAALEGRVWSSLPCCLMHKISIIIYI